MLPIYWYFVLFTATLSCFSEAEIIIKSTKSGLVFDGNQKNVKGVKPDGSEGQKWTLECQQDGHFIIVNAKDGLVLDIQKGCKSGQNMIVYEKHSLDNQQFYINSDGTIGTACDKGLILQIKNGNVMTVTRTQANGLDVFFKLEEV